MNGISVIAHYRKGYVLLRMLAFVLFLILLYAFTLSEQILTRKPLLAPLAIFFWVGGLVCFWFAFTVLKRVVFENGRAVWVENGTLVFLHRWALSARCREIDAISSGRYGRFDRLDIFLQMKDGTQKIIPAESMTEPSDLIIARIKEAISAT